MYNRWAYDNTPFIRAGTVLYKLANLGGVSLDGDGDLIVGALTLECIAGGDVLPVTLLINQVQACSIDGDCDDRKFCTGNEVCLNEGCVAEGDPCPPGNICIEELDFDEEQHATTIPTTTTTEKPPPQFVFVRYALPMVSFSKKQSY